MTAGPAQRTRCTPTITLPPVPRRTDGPYCPTCGMTAGHWTGCPHERDTP